MNSFKRLWFMTTSLMENELSSLLFLKIRKSSNCRSIHRWIVGLNDFNLRNHNWFPNYRRTKRFRCWFPIAGWVENDDGRCEWVGDYGGWEAMFQWVANKSWITAFGSWFHGQIPVSFLGGGLNSVGRTVPLESGRGDSIQAHLWAIEKCTKPDIPTMGDFVRNSIP